MAQQKTATTEVAVPEAITDAAEIQSMSEVQAKLASLADKPMVFSTFEGDDIETKKVLASAVTDASPLNEHLNEPFFLKNFVVQATTMVNDDGEEQPILRIILVTADGEALSCAADGIFKVLQTYTGIFGHPREWPAEGIQMKAVEERGRRGFRYLTLKLV